MTRTTTFTKGSGLYKCRCCGRKTRDDGNGDSVHVQLCTECFDLGGIENGLSDTGKISQHDIETARASAAVIADRGGEPGVWDDLLRKIDALCEPKVPQLDTIAPELQKDVISSFWTMLGLLENQVENSDGNLHLTKHWVEGWYRQWNSITNDDKKPKWLEAKT